MPQKLPETKRELSQLSTVFTMRSAQTTQVAPVKYHQKSVAQAG